MSGKKYKIGYIDEDEAEVREFKRFAKSDFDIVTFQLNENTTLDSLFNEIMQSEVSALVIDFDLKETNIISFNGDKVVEKVKEELLDFPLLVLTAYASAALDFVEEVDIVVEKSQMNEKSEMLLKKLRRKIEHYYDKLDNAENELLQLTGKKDKQVLSDSEEDRLVELDNFIQRSIFNKDKLPGYLKKQQGIEKLDRLISRTEELLKEIKKEDE